MKKLVKILVGLPGSGKSTRAKEIQSNRPGEYVRINKDDLRAMMFDGRHSKAREEVVKSVRDDIITNALYKGYNVIVDDTNLNPVHIERIEELVESIRDESGLEVAIEIDDSFLQVPLEECIKRDLRRGEKVGQMGIIGMYNRYIRPVEEKKEYPHDPGLPNCIIVDVDGTLTSHQGRNPFDYEKAGSDLPNQPVIDMIHTYYRGYTTVKDKPPYLFFFSAREDIGNCKKITKAWLWDYVIKDYLDGMADWSLVLREKGDHRSDYIVKEEMFDENIRGKYNPLFVVDDRKQVIDMWRSKKITVFDVAGNRF